MTEIPPIPLSEARRRNLEPSLPPASRLNDPTDAPDPGNPELLARLRKGQEAEARRRAAEGPDDIAQEDMEEIPPENVEPLENEPVFSETKETWGAKEMYESLKDAENVFAENLREAHAAEMKAAKLMSKAARTLGDTMQGARDLFIETPRSLLNFLVEEGNDFAHDLSDTVLGTQATDKLKGFWGNIFGKKNAAIRGEAEQHRGVREVPGIAKASFKDFPQALWKSVSEIPGTMAQALDNWAGPDAVAAYDQLGLDIEEKAYEDRNKVLAGIEREEKALRSQGLSEGDLQAALERLQDKKDMADADYEEQVTRAADLSPSVAATRGKTKAGRAVSKAIAVTGMAAKGAVWWALRGIPKVLAVFPKPAADYLAMDGLVSEMAGDLAKGIRQERRKRYEEKNPGVPLSRDVSATWKPSEQAMGVMESLGDWIASKAERLREARDEHTDTLRGEAKLAAQREANIYQDAISKRIESLTEKTKLSNEDRGEIAYLMAKLARVRQGLAGAEELEAAHKRAEALAQKAESQQDDMKTLMGYLAGKTINTLRSLDIMKGRDGKKIIEALQTDPSPENIRTAEALVHMHIYHELEAASQNLLSPEQITQLQDAHAVLRENAQRATDAYKDSLATISADIAKQLKAANVDIKKAAVQAEAAHEEEQFAQAAK